MRVFIQIRNYEMAWINADHIIGVWRNVHTGEATLKIVGYPSHEYSVLPYEMVQKLLLSEMPESWCRDAVLTDERR